MTKKPVSENENMDLLLTRASVDMAAICIFWINAEGRFVYVNDAACRMLEYSREEFFRMRVSDIDPDYRIETLPERLARYREKGAVSFETRQHARSGRVIPVRVSVNYLRFGNQEYLITYAEDITRQKQAEEELHSRKNLLETIINGTWDILSIKQVDYTVERYNQSGYDLLGLPPEKVNGRKCFALIGRDQPCSPCATRIAIETKKAANIEKFVPELGIFLDCRSSPVIDEKGNVVRVVEHLRDITSRRNIENKLREEEEKYRNLVEMSPDAIAIVDDEGTFLTVNHAMAKRFGISREQMEGRQHRDVMPEATARRRTEKINQALEQDSLIVFEDEREGRYYQNYHLPISISGRKNACQIISRDITESRQLEEKLRQMSLHDFLTGLYNRAYLENELRRLAASREYPVTIICMDLDGLKLINDTFGHDRGDRQLKACAAILQDAFRGSDVVARVGGDEFTALLPRTPLDAGERAADRLRDKIERFNQEQEVHVPLSLSIGVACARDATKNLEEIFKQADDLMYRDKLNRDVNIDSRIMNALMIALEERDFITHGHARRLEDLCAAVGRKAGLGRSRIPNLGLLCRVHDLGKVGIPDSILFKPGPLTEDEWTIMRQHPEKGYRIAHATTELAGIADLILKHHERWDGRGYPLGLEKDEIPLECRILAIVDAWDAMTNDRPYKTAVSHETAVEELKRCAGTQFDPEMVEIFLKIIDAPPNTDAG